MYLKNPHKKESGCGDKEEVRGGEGGIEEGSWERRERSSKQPYPSHSGKESKGWQSQHAWPQFPGPCSQIHGVPVLISGEGQCGLFPSVGGLEEKVATRFSKMA
jgi:hypothetical protein